MIRFCDQRIFTPTLHRTCRYSGQYLHNKATPHWRLWSRAHDSTHSKGLILSVSVSWPHNAWLPWLQANHPLWFERDFLLPWKGWNYTVVMHHYTVVVHDHRKDRHNEVGTAHYSDSHTGLFIYLTNLSMLQWQSSMIVQVVFPTHIKGIIVHKVIPNQVTQISASRTMGGASKSENHLLQYFWQTIVLCYPSSKMTFFFYLHRNHTASRKKFKEDD